MTVDKTGGTLLIRDNPAVFWLFYSAFVLGGCVALLLGLRLDGPWWQSALAAGIGAANILGGLHMLRKEPASVVRLDPARGTLSVTRWGLCGRRRDEHPLGAVLEARVETGEHSEGGEVYRPGLLMRDGSAVPLSCFWYQTDRESRTVVAEVNAALGGGRAPRLAGTQPPG